MVFFCILDGPFPLSFCGLFLSVLKVIILSASDLISRTVLLRSLSMSGTMSSYGATMVSWPWSVSFSASSA